MSTSADGISFVISNFVSSPENYPIVISVVAGASAIFIAAYAFAVQAMLFGLRRSRVERERRAIEAALDPTVFPAPSDMPNAILRSLTVGGRTPRNEAVAILFMTRDRMAKESDRLSKNSSRNLSFGISFSLLAITSALMTAFLFGYKSPISGDFVNYVFSFAPKLTLSILVQIVGFFFLRMYVSMEGEMRMNKNEISNVDMKIAALIYASDLSAKVRGEVTNSLMSQERNFVLKKDERAIGSMEHVDKNEIIEAIQSLSSSLGGKADK